MDGFNFVHVKNYFNRFLVTVTFYYTIFDKILKIFYVFLIFLNVPDLSHSSIVREIKRCMSCNNKTIKVKNEYTINFTLQFKYF